MFGKESSIAVKPAPLIASRRRGSVSFGLQPIEQEAYERGMFWRLEWGIDIFVLNAFLNDCRGKMVRYTVILFGDVDIGQEDTLHRMHGDRASMKDCHAWYN